MIRSTAFSVAAAAAALSACATMQNQPSLSSAQGECRMSPREVVAEFSDLFYRQKMVRAAFEQWVHPDYIQHKPTLPNGRDVVVDFLERLIERNPERTFTVKRIIASDDLVAVHYHSQSAPDDAGFAVVDMFRVQDCLMVEHWDVVQPVPEQSANNNTMF